MIRTELKRMLSEFEAEIRAEGWFGKEHELVSRFAFSKLVKNLGCCPELYDAGQFGIEVRVRQIKEGKKEVRKDLVIWPSPDQTVWTTEAAPICIIERKRENRKVAPEDIEWLELYTAANPACFGIAVNVEFKPSCTVQAVLIENGSILDANWL